MRIAYVNQDPGISPSKQKGATVHVKAMRRAFELLGATVFAIDSNDNDSVIKALQDAQPLDFIYERYSLGCGTAYRFASDSGTRYVLEVNSPLEQEAVLYRGAEHVAGLGASSANHQMFAKADMVLAVSSEVAEYARSKGATSNNLRLEPNGVDLDRFRPREPSDQTRAELIPPGAFVIGFHGRARPWHNLPMLIDACADLIDEGLHLHLMLVGKGDYEELLGCKIPKTSYTLVPWTAHEQIGRYVACFDALVMTHSASAPFYFSPLKLYEAMAAGVPTIAPRLGDLAKLLVHEETALLFQADDLEDLKNTIRRLVNDPELRRGLGAEARKEAGLHSWERIASSVMGEVLS